MSIEPSASRPFSSTDTNRITDGFSNVETEARRFDAAMKDEPRSLEDTYALAEDYIDSGKPAFDAPNTSEQDQWNSFMFSDALRFNFETDSLQVLTEREETGELVWMDIDDASNPVALQGQLELAQITGTDPSDLAGKETLFMDDGTQITTTTSGDTTVVQTVDPNGTVTTQHFEDGEEVYKEQFDPITGESTVLVNEAAGEAGNPQAGNGQNGADESSGAIDWETNPPTDTEINLAAAALGPDATIEEMLDQIEEFREESEEAQNNPNSEFRPVGGFDDDPNPDPGQNPGLPGPDDMTPELPGTSDGLGEGEYLPQDQSTIEFSPSQTTGADPVEDDPVEDDPTEPVPGPGEGTIDAAQQSAQQTPPSNPADHQSSQDESTSDGSTDDGGMTQEEEQNEER